MYSRVRMSIFNEYTGEKKRFVGLKNSYFYNNQKGKIKCFKQSIIFQPKKPTLFLVQGKLTLF